MNDQIVAGIEQVFAELDAETTETHYPTEEIVAACNRRVAVLPRIDGAAGLASVVLTTFYAGALWRERALLSLDDDLDMRATLIQAAKTHVEAGKHPEASGPGPQVRRDVLEGFLNLPEGTLG